MCIEKSVNKLRRPTRCDWWQTESGRQDGLRLWWRTVRIGESERYFSVWLVQASASGARARRGLARPGAPVGQRVSGALTQFACGELRCRRQQQARERAAGNSTVCQAARWLLLLLSKARSRSSVRFGGHFDFTSCLPRCGSAPTLASRPGFALRQYHTERRCCCGGDGGKPKRLQRRGRAACKKCGNAAACTVRPHRESSASRWPGWRKDSARIEHRQPAANFAPAPL